MSTESEACVTEPSEEGAEKQFAYFDFRVILTEQGDYEIRDVYYDADGEVTGWGSEPNYFIGEDLEDLAAGIGYAVRAMARPLLVESELLAANLPLAPEDGSAGQSAEPTSDASSS